jgi:DNA repair exonuclease SbcCD ATPase subunit
MLTAHRENDQDTVKSFAQGHPTTRSFDRVVNSIDGLRERVQKFSVEQLSEVDQSLNAMSSRLAELQKTLKAIREIKDQLEQIKVQRAEAESLQQNCMAALDRAVPVQSITQVCTLL